MGAYRTWLVTELETIGTPVDLVGHDVGGSAVVALAVTRPDLISTWVSYVVLGAFDPDYVWHDFAWE